MLLKALDASSARTMEPGRASVHTCRFLNTCSHPLGWPTPYWWGPAAPRSSSLYTWQSPRLQIRRST
eukprot:2674470-Alexandrium_andersonii.AAC.1